MSTATSGTATATDMEIAERISNALIIKHVSVKALAEKTGLTYPTLRRSLAGERSLTVVEFRKIADAIEIKPSFLLPDFIQDSAA